MIATSVKGKVFVLAVFVLGVVAGALLFNVYETRFLKGSEVADLSRRVRPDQAREQAIKSFREYVGVDEHQQAEIKKIMDEQLVQFRKLQEQTHPQYVAIGEKTRERVKALLTDEQKRKYDEYRAKQQQQRGQRGPRPGGDGKSPFPPNTNKN
jgi:hypothetical protein